MQDFIAAYGLWILIVLALIAIIAFLFRGKGTDKAIAAPPPPTPSASEKLASTPVVEPVTPSKLAEPVPAAKPGSVGEPDNLQKIKGIGPKVNGILIGLGITRYEQIAGWTAADLADIDRHLGNFAGRPVRDQWIDQASYLARGDITGFEAKYGKL